MATIYIRARQTGSGRRFDVRYRRLGRYSKVEHGGTFKRKGDAQIRLNLISEWLAGAKDPKIELARVTSDGVLFAEMHRQWMASKLGVHETTRGLYRSRGKTLNLRFGSTPVERIAVADVIEWVRELNESGSKPGTIRLYLGDLKQTLDFAGLPVNVARDRRVNLPYQRAEEIVPPTADQMLNILNHTDELIYRILIVTMEQLGSRISETMALTRDDIWEKTNQIRFPREKTKGGYGGRVVNAPEFLVQALIANLPLKVPTRQTINNHLRPYGFSSKDMRHRRASLWVQTEGVSLRDLADRLGNTPDVALQVYSHVMPLDEIPHQTLASFLR